MGGGDHHGHGKLYEIPDWKIYRVEDAPKLVQVQKMLAQKGLKDPWLRNEVWRYHPGYGNTRRGLMLVLRGFQWGLIAAVATTIIGKVMSDSHSHSPSPGGHH